MRSSVKLSALVEDSSSPLYFGYGFVKLAHLSAADRPNIFFSSRKLLPLAEIILHYSLKFL